MKVCRNLCDSGCSLSNLITFRHDFFSAHTLLTLYPKKTRLMNHPVRLFFSRHNVVHSTAWWGLLSDYCSSVECYFYTYCEWCYVPILECTLTTNLMLYYVSAIAKRSIVQYGWSFQREFRITLPKFVNDLIQNLSVSFSGSGIQDRTKHQFLWQGFKVLICNNNLLCYFQDQIEGPRRLIMIQMTHQFVRDHSKLSNVVMPNDSANFWHC